MKNLILIFSLLIATLCSCNTQKKETANDTQIDTIEAVDTVVDSAK